MIPYWVLLLTVSLHSTDAYKFLVYSPIYGYSHTNFMGALADTLTEAGHDVTVLMPILDEEQQNKTALKLTTKVIKIPPPPSNHHMKQYKEEAFAKMWTMEPSVFGMIQMAKNMTTSFVNQCEALFDDDALLKQLVDEKFDVGITETVMICGLAGMATYSDRMNIIERFKNALSIVVGGAFFSNVFVAEIEILRRKFGPQFKSYEELIADTSYAFTNSNPYLDYPRPMLQKTIPIGGIAVALDPKNNVLSKDWDSILGLRNTTVLVSFGSMAKSMSMPDEYKKTLLKVFESMPETTFIWKYEEKGSKFAAHLKNVHLSTWVPQNALLADPRLTVFVTHGGLGSTTELAHMGKPSLLVPLFADQTRNANMLAKHGGGIVLKKDDLGNSEKLTVSLKRLLNDASYSRNAKRLADMLLNQPISAKELFIKHCEFAAKFGRLPNLDPYGRQLSFFQYYIDIILVVLTAFVVCVFVVVKIIRRCSVSGKIKSE